MARNQTNQRDHGSWVRPPPEHAKERHHSDAGAAEGKASVERRVRVTLDRGTPSTLALQVWTALKGLTPHEAATDLDGGVK